MQQKLSLATLMLLAAFGANATSVNIYGSISTGLVATHTRATAENGNKSTTGFSMQSAWAGDSIWGITAKEDLGNGWAAGVALENEYESHTGRFTDDNTIFNSMAYLWVGTDQVKLSLGNLGGALSSGGGDFDLIGGFDPLEAAYGLGGMGLISTKDLAPDTAVSLELTPVEGLKISAQASLGDNTIAKWSQREHYYGLGALYENGSLAAAASAEMVRRSSLDTACGRDAHFLTAALSWDAGFIKPMAIYQYADKMSLGSFADNAMESAFRSGDKPGKINSLLIGATAPVAGGTLGISAQYAVAKFTETAKKGKAYTLGIAYTYELSKRTSLYAAGVMVKGKKEFAEFDAFNQYQAGIGINHTF